MTVHPRLAACAGLLAALLIMAMGFVPAGALPGASVPPPEQDAFYDDSRRKPGAVAPGTVLKSRTVEVTGLGLPLPVDAWQIGYASRDAKKDPVVDVATVIVPRNPWLGDGPRPLLSYQTAEDGLALECAPSYTLRTGTEKELPAIYSGLLQGWAVVVPDYEGPESQYGPGWQAGRAVLDGIRATLRFKPAGIDAAAPIGLWGYSGGAVASSQAANLMRTYAPKLRIAGIALGGLPADFRASLKAFDGSALFGLALLAIIGLDRAHTKVDLTKYATKKGKRAMAAEQHSCANDVTTKYAFEKMSDYVKDPGILDRPEIKALIKYNSPIGITGNPSAPVYSYHSVNDQVAPVARNRALMKRYCAAGVRVQQYEDYASEHITLVATGGPAAFAYLSDRFAGTPAPSTCGSGGLLGFVASALP